MKHTNEELDKKFDSLPRELKEAITSVSNAEKLVQIGNEFGLNLDQTGELGEEMGAVMTGLSSPTDFAKNIEERLGIGKDLAEKITSRANEIIFYPIRDSLRKILQNAGEAEIDRDAILREIENPSAENRGAGDLSSNIINKQNSTEKDRTTLIGVHTPPPPPPSILEQKLSTTIQSPIRKYSVDPYREPVN